MADSAAPGTQHIQLAVGDRVVYPNQGVCRVEAIEPMEVAGQKLTFVTMKREEDGAVVRVPQAKVAAIGVRKVAGGEEIESIFDFLRSDSDRANLDWKQRARTNLDRMTTGGVLGMAEVVKGLQVLSELRPLPTKERELYDNARHLLVNEIAASLDIPEQNAEDAIDFVLFPPGKDRPKRTAEEFKQRADDEGLELGDDLLGLGDDLDLPSDEEEPQEEEEEVSESEEAEEEEAPKKKAKAAKAPAKPAAAKSKAKAAPRAELSDDDVTMPFATALVPDEEVPAPKKRGRPPKVKTEAEAKPKKAAEPAAPKKRGRPPKAKTEAEAKPAKSKKK